jgi:hypothetical protein
MARILLISCREFYPFVKMLADIPQSIVLCQPHAGSPWLEVTNKSDGFCVKRPVAIDGCKPLNSLRVVAVVIYLLTGFIGQCHAQAELGKPLVAVDSREP